MKKTRLFSIFIFVLILTSCGIRRSTTYYDFETKLIGTELDGSYTLRSWGRARNAPDAFVQAQKQAVYDIIFSGVKGTTTEKSLKPLLLETNAREKYEDYFNAFFADGGKYREFCSLKEKRDFSSRYARSESQAVCQTTVCVFRSKLRQFLIDEGILK